jgi:3-oxoacyl-[acyl-carrier protein] reductase
MELGLHGKVALVTASSRGIGKAIAMALSNEGCDVAICARGEEGLQKTASEIRDATGRQVSSIVADVSQASDIKRLIDTTLDQFNHVDILVCNAGGPPPGQFMDMREESWDQALEQNLKSVIRLCRALIPGMKERSWGRIITITSTSVFEPLPNLILSNVTRAAVNNLVHSLARELAPYGILVNNVMPGSILTQRTYQLRREQAEKTGESVETLVQKSAQDIPIGRLGTPEELANLVVFLASEKASYITGESLAVDGGSMRSVL